MHECKHFIFSVHNPNSKALCLYVGLQCGRVGSLCFQSIHKTWFFKSIFVYTSVLTQRHCLKSKCTICCYAVIQHFPRSLLSAIYCIFHFKSGRKGDLPGIFHCVFPTQIPLKLSAWFCCKKRCWFCKNAKPVLTSVGVVYLEWLKTKANDTTAWY